MADSEKKSAALGTVVPTKGIDYWTEADKQEILKELETSVLPAVTEADNGKVMQVVNGQWEPVESSGGGSVYLTTVNGTVAPERINSVLDAYFAESYNSDVAIYLVNYESGLTLQFLTSEPITEWTTDLLTGNTSISLGNIYVHVEDDSTSADFYAIAGVHSVYYAGGSINFSFCSLYPTESPDFNYCGNGQIRFSDFAAWVSQSKVRVQKVG